jgi:hypothetical protein
MGANQSRQAEVAIKEQLLERLQALNMKDDRSIK